MYCRNFCWSGCRQLCPCQLALELFHLPGGGSLRRLHHLCHLHRATFLWIFGVFHLLSQRRGDQHVPDWPRGGSYYPFAWG